MIELDNVCKTYRMGDAVVRALDKVSLKIERGEFVAVMGPSGSGKSTLMHVLGLLDRPDSGSYRLLGRETADLKEDELAELRRHAVGFVFQQFNLLPRMTALENTALPLLYSEGRPDVTRAAAALDDMGLGDRANHRPNELSGGQQQRVAIARSLINAPALILADEPTGNLDTTSQHEIMTVLRRLNDSGITLVIVTHEEEIGSQARRLIRMRDGAIVADERQNGAAPSPAPAPRGAAPGRRTRFGEFWEHLKQGLKTLGATKIRTGLSMLGVLIGVAAVVAMLAVGKGAQRAIEQQLAGLGSNLLMLRQGAGRVGGVALEAGAATRLTLDDAASLMERVPSVIAVSPSVTGRAQVSYLNRNWNTLVRGVSPSYAQMRAAEPEIGQFFTDEDNVRRGRVAVIGATVVRELFGDRNPLGEMVKVNKVNFQIIGILPEKGATGWRDQDDVIVVPVMTAMHRLLGKDYVDSIDIQVDSPDNMRAAEQAILELMLSRHRVPALQRQDAYQIRNMAEIQAAATESSRTMAVLLSSIAAISLLVGGIGIMNIMLVSVTERTREIGLRKAVGARRRDIMTQFLVEAVVISVVGGLMGIALGWLISLLISLVAGWATEVSVAAALLAFLFSAIVGIVFGIFPARKAARLDPIRALRYE